MSQQRDAARAVARQVLSLPEVQRANTLALYLANDGELDPAPLQSALGERQKRCCLPVLHPFKKGHLLFLEHAPHGELTFNRFNIPEPPLDVTRIWPLATLDVILTPLVAFDDAGNRLGMGGGFYDRTLASYQGHIIGLAHDCQQVDAVPVEAWDQPLEIIVTPGGVKRFRR
ncbi:5-formyltetrahydrofolate cyclo-ligase [Gallaecimonas sp. GXIMD4217]|uniref:5-formyltetrahydrofolate cyclo-ligase n=1 Tax=Gallaecimonas sp. GXIMD4217 TaxID=3131927 RepID=UPI00311ACBF3